MKRIFRTGVTPEGTPEAIADEARDVLGRAFGEDGARKREKVRRLREQFKAAWDRGGDSYRATEKLLADAGI